LNTEQAISPLPHLPSRATISIIHITFSASARTSILRINSQWPSEPFQELPSCAPVPKGVASIDKDFNSARQFSKLGRHQKSSAEIIKPRQKPDKLSSNFRVSAASDSQSLGEDPDPW
jgi:hypothetical protein